MSSKKPLYWIKLWIKMLDDPNVGMLTEHLQLRYIKLQLIAGEVNNKGALPPSADIAWRLRTSPEDLHQDLLQLAAAGLVDRTGIDSWRLPDYGTTQGPSPATLRKRRQRQREAEAPDSDLSYDQIQDLKEIVIFYEVPEEEEEGEEETDLKNTEYIYIRSRDIRDKCHARCDILPKHQDGNMLTQPVGHQGQKHQTTSTTPPETDDDAIRAVMHLEDYWTELTGGNLPNQFNRRADDYFKPLNQLLLQVQWDTERAKQLLKDARRQMLAEGYTPVRAAAVMPRIYAILDAEQNQPSTADQIAEALARFQ